MDVVETLAIEISMVSASFWLDHLPHSHHRRTQHDHQLT